MHQFQRIALFALCALPLVCGCGRPAVSVRGQVTYEGQPVDNGFITFLPADGLGPTCAGPIAGGKYQVDGLTAGPKIAQIIGVKEVRFAVSREEMAEAAKQAAKSADYTGIIDRADVIPPEAQGNNARVEIKTGSQTRDFPLKRPAGKAPGGL
jgi:hypothetical protein